MHIIFHYTSTHYQYIALYMYVQNKSNYVDMHTF